MSELDKVIYVDVDVLFKSDLSEIWNIDLGSNILGVVKDLGINLRFDWEYYSLKSPYWNVLFDGKRGSYFNSGFLLMNLAEIRNSTIYDKWIEMAKQNFNFQDQDILNATCTDKVKFLSLKFNTMCYFVDKNFIKKIKKEKNTKLEENIKQAINNPAVIHYVVQKPWKDASVDLGEQWINFVQANEDLNVLFPDLTKNLFIQKIKKFFNQTLMLNVLFWNFKFFILKIYRVFIK